MRIQHNIAALNSYRNLTNNNSAVSKNLEKLSSGYRINRAGDDAAGLAISEKMRAQITGLKTAQKNANDGISLVQTAEGALTEVHSMLNRMVELANQSANGTYADEVDRENLQKEVESLKSEINRIAEGTNYNGIKLLDGSLDSEGKKIVSTPSFSNLTGVKLQNVSSGAEDAPQLHVNATPSGGKTSFTVNLQGIAYNANGADISGDQHFNLYSLKADGSNGDVVADLKYKVTANTAGNVTGKEIAEGIVKAYNSDNPLKLTFDNGGGDAVEIEYEVKLGDDGQSLVFTMTDKGYADAVADAGKATGNNVSSDAVKNQNVFEGNFNFVAQNLKAKAADGTDVNLAQDVTAEGYNSMQDSCTSAIHAGGPAAGAQRAEAAIDFCAQGIDIKDGAGVKIGDEYYIWAGTDETFNGDYGDNVKVVDIRDLVDPATGKVKDDFDGTGDSGTFNDRTKALSRLTVAAENNKMFNVQLNNVGTTLVVTENVDNKSDADLTTLAGFKKQVQTFDAVKSNVTTIGGNGKSLTLQVGDTSESFNQLDVKVSSIKTEALGISDIDISTQAGAAAAVDKIKEAINSVSFTRGDLGAIQNRLEHTINNLSVTTENITAAESRIRDVDMAEEMMAYTKNNILVQASQAMLAQANQVPQGVLQLLQ